MMTAYIVRVNGRRVDEVVFLNPKSSKEVKDALIKEGYDPKTLSVKRNIYVKGPLKYQTLYI